MRRPWFSQPAGYDAQRFEMDNGDIALFAYSEDVAYWMGNTETPRALWKTEKYTFEEVPSAVAEWARRELLAQLHEEEPWLAEYPALSRFFLPVLLSKDGRHTSREFFRDHAAGFPDCERATALSYYEQFLQEDPFPNRYEMASKLGTAQTLNVTRMNATMSEFTVGKLLFEAGYELTPEYEVSSGHSIDFRVDRGDQQGLLIEVTRPLPPEKRSAGSAVTSIKETVGTKTGGQLSDHAGGVTLFVDCTSFDEEAWQGLVETQPEVSYRPVVVFRVRPAGATEAFSHGTVPVDLPEYVQFP